MKLACVQANVVFGNPEQNRCAAANRLRALADEGVDLAIFPEAFLTGYCVASLDEAQAISIPRSDVDPLREVCDEVGIACIVGFAERKGPQVANSAALLIPGKGPQFYRKTHLPELGLDRFVEPGDALPVFDTPLGKIGILICFDLRIPEAARVLALQGAELIALPTNWPERAESTAATSAIARALENRVFLAACNRVGEENGFRFKGQSLIVAPSGRILASAGGGEETLVADLDLAEARLKRNVIVPGAFETTVFQSRRPELYSKITEP